MSRTREYSRAQRERVIKRKKYICTVCKGIPDYYKFDGQFSKGKTHCSCGLCRQRDPFGRHLLTLNEARADRRMREGMEYYQEFGLDEVS